MQTEGTEDTKGHGRFLPVPRTSERPGYLLKSEITVFSLLSVNEALLLFLGPEDEGQRGRLCVSPLGATFSHQYCKRRVKQVELACHRHPDGSGQLRPSEQPQKPAAVDRECEAVRVVLPSGLEKERPARKAAPGAGENGFGAHPCHFPGTRLGAVPTVHLRRLYLSQQPPSQRISESVSFPRANHPIQS